MNDKEQVIKELLQKYNAQELAEMNYDRTQDIMFMEEDLCNKELEIQELKRQLERIE